MPGRVSLLFDTCLSCPCRNVGEDWQPLCDAKCECVDTHSEYVRSARTVLEYLFFPAKSAWPKLQQRPKEGTQGTQGTFNFGIEYRCGDGYTNSFRQGVVQFWTPFLTSTHQTTTVLISGVSA